MRIYIATSWKMENIAKGLTASLRERGHEVDCFCDQSSGRSVFHWSVFVDKEEDLKKYDALSFINEPQVRQAFREDRNWLDWAEAVVLIVPSGRSAHLEAGYAKGRGKRLFIWGDFPKGEFDVMYGFADGLYRIEQAAELFKALQEAKTWCGPHAHI